MCPRTVRHDRAGIQIDTPRASAFDEAHAARVVLAAMRGDDLTAFEHLAADLDPAVLDELAASEHGVAWAEVPAEVVPDHHRLRMLHVIARMHRYDDGATHLDIAMFELMLRALEAGDVEWAAMGSRTWTQLINHIGESPSVWPQARSLLERFPDELDQSPLLLGGVAAIAATAGAPEAGPLWDRVLSHPRLGDRADQRLALELDWVRGYLLHHGADPRRGIAVLERLRRGFADSGTPISELRWAEATFELVTALTWVGRPDEAAEVALDATGRVEPGSELELWLQGIRAYPAAHLDDDATVQAAFVAISRAASDTSALRLRTSVPARLVRAARLGDDDLVDDAIGAGLEIEGARPMDPDLRCAWRVHAAEARAACGDDAGAVELLDELLAQLDELPHELPVHRLRHDALRARLQPSSDSAVDSRSLRDRARRLGVDLDAIRVDAVDTAATQHGIALQLLGPFTVHADSEPVPEPAWAGRRQAKVLLALLVARGGTVTTDAVIEALWGEVDPATARNRIGPLCNAIRSVLGCAEESTPARELLVRNGAITLRLHPADHCDLTALRATRNRLLRDPSRRSDALAAFQLLDRRPLADLGEDGATSMLRDELERELLETATILAAAWSGQRAPDVVLDVVERALMLDPTSVETCTRLVQLHADRGDAPAASSAFHLTRTALRTELGMSVPESLARLHAAVLDAPPAEV